MRTGGIFFSFSNKRPVRLFGTLEYSRLPIKQTARLLENEKKIPPIPIFHLINTQKNSVFFA